MKIECVIVLICISDVFGGVCHKRKPSPAPAPAPTPVPVVPSSTYPLDPSLTPSPTPIPVEGGGDTSGTCKFDDPVVFGVVPANTLGGAKDHEVDTNDSHNKVIDLKKNLPISSIGASGHQSSVDGIDPNLKYRFFGRALNYAELNCIFEKLGFVKAIGSPFYEKAIAKIDSVGAYNSGQSPYQRWLGMFNAYSTAAKLKIMPATNFQDVYAASKVYGQLKRQALANNADEMRSTIAAAKGQTLGLTDEQLVGLWGSNEHQNLHAIIFGNPAVHNTIHMTSLNDNDQWGKQFGCEEAMCGGWNDKGQYPQWSGNDASQWWMYAQGFPALFGV